MKTDNYLTLCLEQAAKSPLHYRHGCIIVRGGKVIGQGYNDYRPGFNGGALKTGRIAGGGYDGPAILELKEKHKQKYKQKDSKQQDTALTTSTFTPFESMGGGGHLANIPLSMHSEMMAVHSALSACTKLSSSALSYEKPCFKLPGDSKRKSRLRRQQALESYVTAICGPETCTGQSQVRECGSEATTSQPNQSVRSRRQQKQGERVRVWVQGSVRSGAAGQEQEWGVSRRSAWGETRSEREEEEELEREEREWNAFETSRAYWSTTTSSSGPGICV
jgi:deoxycytidylate deaminase